MSMLDEKAAALRAAYALHPHPTAVSDPLFARGQPFFDARDVVQVRYEMLRHVWVDGYTVTHAAAAAGFSRSAFYAAQHAWATAGLAGLLPGHPGPHGAHKLTAAVLTFIDERELEQPHCSAATLVPLLREHFGLVVHRRSIERARRRQGRLQQPAPAMASSASDLAGAYETLRSWAVSASGVIVPPPGLALLLRRGVPAWLAAWRPCTAPASGPEPPGTALGSPVPLTLSGQVVVILTNMVLSCQREGSV